MEKSGDDFGNVVYSDVEEGLLGDEMEPSNIITQGRRDHRGGPTSFTTDGYEAAPHDKLDSDEDLIPSRVL